MQEYDLEGLVRAYVRRDYLGMSQEGMKERIRRLMSRPVEHLARQYVRTTAEREDLEQVAWLEVMRKLERFDPGAGCTFKTFALASARGAIRHYFRDSTWLVHVPRRIRDLAPKIRHLKWRMEHETGKVPTVEEIAQRAEVTPEAVVQAIEADTMYLLRSLDCFVGDDDSGRFVDYAVDEEAGCGEYGRIIEREALRRALETLDGRKRTVIHLRFFEGRSQSEVAAELGISQMHVSRLERMSLNHMREFLKPHPDSTQHA